MKDVATEKIIDSLYPQSNLQTLSATAKEIEAAVYLRQSTTNGQNCESVDEQLEFIRHRVSSLQARSVLYPSAKIIISNELIFSDYGKTGRVTRDNYEAFKEALKRKDFKVGLVFDLSRLTRELGSLLDVYDLTQVMQVEVISISEGISSHSEGARNHFIFKGFANELSSESTSRSSRRGLEIRACGGLSTGHNPYGFSSKPRDPNIVRGPDDPVNHIVIIDPEKSAVARRICLLYADTNIGVDGIAKILNKEGIPSPKGEKWRGRTILGILKQPKYIGLWIFAKTKTIRNGERIVQVPRPREEWIIRIYEHLRIVPQDVWERVQEKLKRVEEERCKARNRPETIWGKNRGRSNHLLTGTMQCNECGGNFITVTGNDGGRVGCFNAYRQGTCSNKHTALLSRIEEAIIGEMKEWLKQPEVIEYMVKQYNKRLKEKYDVLPQTLEKTERELSKVDREIGNYVNFIKDGGPSSAIFEALKQAETKREELRAKTANLKAQEPKGVFVTPIAIQRMLGDLEGILNRDVATANFYLKRLFPKPMRMVLKKTNRQYLYEAQGEVNLTRLYRYCLPVNGVPNRI